MVFLLIRFYRRKQEKKSHLKHMFFLLILFLLICIHTRVSFHFLSLFNSTRMFDMLATRIYYRNTYIHIYIRWIQVLYNLNKANTFHLIAVTSHVYCVYMYMCVCVYVWESGICCCATNLAHKFCTPFRCLHHFCVWCLVGKCRKN